MNHFRFLIVFCLAIFGGPILAQHGEESGPTPTSETGVLILAHGGQPHWNEAVLEVARRANDNYPAEVAFGMATRRNIQRGIDKLIERGVNQIVAVPLFINSNSSVITSTAFLLGEREEMPEALRWFAKMDHGHGGESSGGASHHGSPAEDGTARVASDVPIQMTPALDHHRIVADILVDRANSISDDPTREVAIVVAHGPTAEEDNRSWLEDMRLLVERMKVKTKFHRIDYLTVRDDAPAPVRGEAAREFRELVEAAQSDGKSALIVPLLVSYGGIEQGLKKRLEGLDYRMAYQGLLPDARLAAWVVESVGNAVRSESEMPIAKEAGVRP